MQRIVALRLLSLQEAENSHNYEEEKEEVVKLHQENLTFNT
jgi:hypothetical protein